MRQPGFEPGLGAWGAPVLDQTGPQPQKYPSSMGLTEVELRFSTHTASSQLTESSKRSQSPQGGTKWVCLVLWF